MKAFRFLPSFTFIAQRSEAKNLTQKNTEYHWKPFRR